MLGTFEAAEVGDARAEMDTIAVHTEEHIEVLGRSYADGNILDTTVAVSCLAALVNRTYRAVSEVGASASGHTAACLTDGGS